MDALLAVLGHTNIDIQVKVEELPVPAGESRPVLDRRTVYGGTACNIARHAAGLGVPVRLWSRVGDDFPPEWKAGLVDDGVDLSFLDVGAGERTPTCTILTDLVDRQSFLMDQGAMGRMAVKPPSHGLLEGLQWLHIGTGDPAAYGAIAAAASQAGVQVAFDPGQEIHFAYDSRSLQHLLDVSDVFFCNEAELAKAFDLLSYGDPVQLLDHVDAVVVTRAADGADLYRSKHKRVHVPAFRVKATDPTGAGDALRAGWYAGLAAGKEPEEALRWGVAAAAVCVTFDGPQSRTLHAADLEPLLQQTVA